MQNTARISGIVITSPMDIFVPQYKKNPRVLKKVFCLFSFTNPIKKASQTIKEIIKLSLG